MAPETIAMPRPSARGARPGAFRKVPSMRSHHPIAFAVAAVTLLGFGVWLVFLPLPKAGADAGSVTGMNLQQMQADDQNVKGLAVQKLHDMSFVFSEGD